MDDFSDLETRAAARAPDTARDRISLRDHVVETEVGAFAEERGRTQRLCFAVVAEVQNAPASDDVDRILSYDHLTGAVGAALAQGRADLLETLAERVAAHVLTAPQAARVYVRVEKLDRGPGNLGVEILRDASGADRAEPGARIGEVVLLEEAETPSEPLGARVCCIVPDPRPLPDTPDPAAARRIALLALDQAAWAMSGRTGLPVVATRTELDHMARAGRTCLWAPSRMAADASCPAEAAALARWLSEGAS